MATTEQVQEALQQLQLQVEETRATTAEQELENALIQTQVTTLSKGTKAAKEQKVRRWQRPSEKAAAVRTKEEGARVRGEVLSSFAKPDRTKDQLKDDEKKRKQSGNGTQEPKRGKQPGNGTQEPVNKQPGSGPQNQWRGKEGSSGNFGGRDREDEVRAL